MTKKTVNIILSIISIYLISLFSYYMFEYQKKPPEFEYMVVQCVMEPLWFIGMFIAACSPALVIIVPNIIFKLNNKKTKT